MAIMNEDYSLFFYDHPLVPGLTPLLGSSKMMEREQDVAYLKYLYPSASKVALPFIEEECDKMEYEGSPMFDAYPDKITFQQLASQITKKCIEKNPSLDEKGISFRDLVEVLLFNEIIFRRERYRNQKRLYF